MKKKKCNCDMCKRHDKWEKFLKKYPFTKNDKEFLDKIYLTLNMTEFEHEISKAVLDGSWPFAIEQLERALVMAKEIKERRDKGERI